MLMHKSKTRKVSWYERELRNKRILRFIRCAQKNGSSRINVIFPLFENQHIIYLRLSMVITIWIYSDLTEMSVVVPPNP